MKQLHATLLLIALLAVQTVSRAQVSFGKPELISDQWQFHLGDEPGAHATDYDASRWRTLDLPHDWSIEGVLSPGLAASRWYTGSGIYRNVYLIYSGPVHIDQWGVFYKTSQLTKKEAIVYVQADIKNETGKNEDLQVSFQLLDAEGQSVAKQTLKMKALANQTGRISANLKVPNPRLWDLETPYLYRLKTSLLLKGRVIDESVQTVGIRELRFDADKGFALNDNRMKLKGVCIHHDAGCLGSAVPKKVWERRLKQLKSLGCNAIRLSHNPQAPDLYDICDEIGLLVIDEAFDEWEFPKKKWLEGWNVGTPGFQGAFAFFEEWSGRDVQDMVRRDYNHPSIIMWSIGNEVDYPNDPYSHPVLDGATINQPMHGGYLPDHPAEEAVGLDNNRETCRHAIQTSGRSYAITATIDRPTLKKDKDLAHVVLQIVDENGLPVILADDEITCTVEGPARLLGLEGSDNSDMGNYRDNRQRAFHGRLLAYIQTSGQTGEIKLIFSSPWLKPLEIRLKSE